MIVAPTPLSTEELKRKRKRERCLHQLELMMQSMPFGEIHLFMTDGCPIRILRIESMVID